MTELNELKLVANIETVKLKENEDVETSFFICLIYFQGKQVDAIIRQYNGEKNEIIDNLQDISVIYSTLNFDLETSSKSIYRAAIEEPGVNAENLHYSETRVTRALIETNRETITELYGGETETREKSNPENEPELPGWKQWLISILKYFITKLEGGITYE